MNVTGKVFQLTILLALALTLLILEDCGGRKEITNQTERSSIEKKDSTFLFNGETLDGWEITNFGPQGPVYVSGGNIILGMGDGCTGITWKGDFPKNNYMITLEAKRITGNDFFCGMTFPVNESFCTLIIGGWGGAVVGLSSINGYDASENETKTIRNFETGKWYNICLTLFNDSIKASIDETDVIDFAIGNNKLSLRPEVRLSKPFGIASWTTAAAIRNIRLKPLK
jgi:hypothetical protein